MAGEGRAQDRASTQNISANEIPLMPEPEALSRAEFQAGSRAVKATPFDDESLSFKVRLPENFQKNDLETREDEARRQANWWEEDPDALQRQDQYKPRIFGLFAEYYGPPVIDTRPRFSLRAIRLEHAIETPHWLRHHARINGYALKDFEAISENRAETFYVSVVERESFFVRAAAVRSGDRMIYATYRVPLKAGRKAIDAAAYAMQSFELLNPSTRPAEETKARALIDIIRFRYPASWDIPDVKHRDLDRLSLRLYSSISGNALDGLIQVTAVKLDNSPDLATEIKRLRQKVAKDGLVIDKLIAEPEVIVNRDHNFLYSEIYEVQSEKRVVPLEYWFTVFDGERHFFFITMLSPSRETDFYSWARNKQAYENLLASIQ